MESYQTFQFNNIEDILNQSIVEFNKIRIGMTMGASHKHDVYDKRGQYGRSNFYPESNYSSYIKKLISEIKNKLPIITNDDIINYQSKLLEAEERLIRGNELLKKMIPKGLSWPNSGLNKKNYPEFKLKQYLIDIMENFNVPDLNYHGIKRMKETEFENNPDKIWILNDFIDYHLKTLKDIKSAVKNEMGNRKLEKEDNLRHHQKAIKTIDKRYTHREKALAYTFQMRAHKELKSLTREEMRNQGGKNYEIAFDSLNEPSTTYKSPTRKELLAVIEILQNDEDALKLAKEQLDKIS